MSKKRLSQTKSKLTPVAIYRDRSFRWRDLFTLFLPGTAAPLFPLLIGYWREQYALNNYGPVAAQSWSLPWYRLSILALIPLLWLALRRVRRAHRFIKVYPKGIIIQSTWGKRWKLTWSQIQGISGVKVQYKFFGIHIKSEYQAILHPLDGRPIKLDEQINDLEELCARIKGKIYPKLLQRCREAFQNGDTLTFGPIKINNYQIAIKNKTLPWAQVKSLEPAGGLLRLEYEENRRKKIPVKEIPNVEILLQILQEGVIYD